MKASRNQSDISQKSSATDRAVTASRKPTSGRRSDTAVTAAAACDKGTDSGKTKTDDKPKETLEDMERFLKQLKANKQQMLKK